MLKNAAGYYWPVEQFNIGKQEKYKERALFDDSVKMENLNA